MTFILIFLLLSGGGMLVANCSRSRFEKALPFFVLALVSLLYWFGIFGALKAGLILSIVFSCGGLLVTAFLILNQKSRMDTVKRIFTPGFIAFFLLLAALFVINRSKNFIDWDDFSHWGVMIKETLRLDQLYSVPESVLSVHKDYPPIVCLFEYWFIKIKGEYSEPSVFISLQLFTLIFLLPAFENARFKGGIKFLSLLALTLVLPCVAGINLYDSTYIDATLGVLFGYTLTAVVVSRRSSGFDLANLVLSCFALTLVKQSGFFFAAVALLYMALYSAGCFLKHRKRLGPKKSAVRCLMPAAPVFSGFAAIVVGKLSWACFLNVCQVGAGQFSLSQISISGIFSILNRTAPADQIMTFQNFVTAVLTRPIVTDPFDMTYFQMLIVCTALTGLLWFVFRKSKYSGRIKLFSCVTLLTGAGYAGAMLLLYLFSFSSYEGLKLASYERYMSTFFVGIACALFLILTAFHTKALENPPLRSEISWLLLAALVCGIWIGPATYTHMLPFRREDPHYYKNKVYAESLAEVVDFETDKVYLVLQGSSGGAYWAIKYYANPLRTNPSFSWSIGSKVNESDIWTKQMSAAQWRDLLLQDGYGYVYVMGTSARFAEEFGALFENPSEIRNDTVFRVDRLEQSGRILKKMNR